MESENSSEWTLTPQQVFMLLHKWRMSATLFLRTVICKRKKVKEHQQWMRLKICPHYQVWDLLWNTPWINSQTPQGHEDFSLPLKPPPLNTSIPTHRHHQGRILSYQREYWWVVRPKEIDIRFGYYAEVGAEHPGKLCVHFVKIECSLTLWGGAWWKLMMGIDDGKW